MTHYAVLNQEGRALYGLVLGDIVPVLSPVRALVLLDGESSPVPCYFVDLRALTRGERVGLLDVVARRFGVSREEVSSQVGRYGLPLRESMTIGVESMTIGVFSSLSYDDTGEDVLVDEAVDAFERGDDDDYDDQAL